MFSMHKFRIKYVSQESRMKISQILFHHHHCNHILIAKKFLSKNKYFSRVNCFALAVFAHSIFASAVSFAAIGSLAIARLSLKKGRIDSLKINDLTIRNLRVENK